MKSLNKNARNYRITVEEIQADAEQASSTLQFEVQDREDMLKIVEALQSRSSLESDDAARVGVALRLLGPVMMQNRKHPLFSEFMPHFKDFMLNLKKTVKSQ